MTPLCEKIQRASTRVRRGALSDEMIRTTKVGFHLGPTVWWHQLFDYIIGAREHDGRNLDGEGLGRSSIDDQFEPSRNHHRQVFGPLVRSPEHV